MDRACVPVGSIEVHGPVLDGLVIYSVASEASRRSPTALVLPPLYYAYVPEIRYFPGVISLSGSTSLKLFERSAMRFTGTGLNAS
ncbi:MAG: creatininase family protein [Thermofilum sp.]